MQLCVGEGVDAEMRLGTEGLERGMEISCRAGRGRRWRRSRRRGWDRGEG